MVKNNVFKKTVYNESVTNVNVTDSDKYNLEKRFKILVERYLRLVTILTFKTIIYLKKICFNARIAEASKSFAIKNQVENALDLGDKK